MDVSPFLSAIQALKGETPGEKYQDLHSIAIKIIENEEEKNNFLKNGTTTRVPSALHPTLRILVGLKLKSKEAVIEALKSDDVTIVKLALGAKWFFNVSNDLINVDYFSDKLLPFVSVKTRLELIKVLSRSLKVEQAESFHRRFIELFGSDQALPLLMSCSQDYIYDEILKYKMLLSDRILKRLYRKYPQFVIRYLRFIKEGKAKDWSKDGRSVEMRHYHRFLPNLIKNHTQEFLEFDQSISVTNRWMRMGNTRAEYLLENAADVVVEQANEFFHYLPVKTLKKKLSKQQYGAMLQNLFPKDISEFNTYIISHYIQAYYPKEGAFELFREKYRKAYSHDLLENQDLLEYDGIYEVLPQELKAECSRKFVNAIVDKSRYWKNVRKLPPKESIPLLKEQITKSSYLSREESLRDMLTTCNLYNSKEDLLEVLRYYNTRHKNEQAAVTLSWLEGLASMFNGMKSLDKEHWQIIKDILQKAHIRGNINDWPKTQNFPFCVLDYLLKQRQNDESEERDKVILDAIINVILENFLGDIKKHNNFMNRVLDQKGIFLENVLAVVQKNYPETHAVWKKNNNKLILTTNIIQGMGEVNEKKAQALSDRMLIQNYPWLKNFTAELFVNKERYNRSRDYSAFDKCLRKYFPEYRQNLIDEHSDMINDVTTDDALMLLKHDRNKILAKIDAYVASCRSQLAKDGKSKKWYERSGKSARRFVMALKWYQDVPLKFVEKCLAEIEENGSVLILGILLEGEVLCKIVQPYLPKEIKLEVNSENAKKNYELVSSIPRALNYANPPPALEALIPFCRGDYLSVALSALSSIAQRLPVDRVLYFTNHLENNTISVKKAGYRLVFQVSPKPEFIKFLTKICKKEKNSGVRGVVGKMVHKVFTQTPSPESWQLMKEFIHGLLPSDKNMYAVLKKLKTVNADYIDDYTLEVFKKINSYNDEELNEQEKSSLILSVLEECKDKHAFNKLPENVINEIVTKVFLECSLDFIFDIYLFYDEQKFEDRLKVVIEIISENLQQLDKVDQKKLRFYPMFSKIYEKIASKYVIEHLEKNENKNMNRRFIASILEIVALQQYLHCFVTLNIYDVFQKSSGPMDFGKKCGENVDSLIKIYNNEIIIEHYGNLLKAFVECFPVENQKFDVIDGLKSHNFKYGVLIGLKLLEHWKVNRYDERYDEFVEATKNNDDVAVQAFLNKFLSDINYYGYC